MNRKTIFGVSFLLGLLTVMVFVVALCKRDPWYGALKRNEADANPTPATNYGHATWASNAVTVEELLLESDLVVKARVVRKPITRVMRFEIPTKDEDGNTIDSTVIKVLFSDTVFEVLDTYVGKPSKKITIMQTGGFDPSVSKNIHETADDPLYKVGEEYILFLVDVSGDSVHAPNRELYRTVNPFGRIGIVGDNIFSYGPYTGQYAGLPTAIPILNISDLESQIQQAISLLSTPAEMSTETTTPSPISSPTDLLTETSTSLPLPTETPSPTLTPAELPTETPTETLSETPTSTETPTP